MAPVVGTSGTFNGVPGKFTSATGITTLRVGIDGKGVPSWPGSLNFEPNSGTSMVMMEDDAYTSLGWWLTEAANGDLTPMVAAWASTPAYVADLLAGVTGKATFEGIAVGKVHPQDRQLDLRRALQRRRHARC